MSYRSYGESIAFRFVYFRNNFVILQNDVLFFCHNVKMYNKQLIMIICYFTEQASLEQVLIFLADSWMLKRTTHHNISSPLHICSDRPTPMVIFPFMNRGNLKNYLRLTRTAEPLSRVKSQLLNFILNFADSRSNFKTPILFSSVIIKDCFNLLNLFSII